MFPVYGELTLSVCFVKDQNVKLVNAHYKGKYCNQYATTVQQLIDYFFSCLLASITANSDTVDKKKVLEKRVNSTSRQSLMRKLVISKAYENLNKKKNPTSITIFCVCKLINS